MITKKLTEQIIGPAIEVHRLLGPGLLESGYEAALEHELQIRGLKVERQVMLPVTYKDLILDEAYRLDLLVEDLVILELKCVEALKPMHNGQLLTYLRMSGRSLGYILNFDVNVLTQGGLRRFVHHYHDS